MHHSSSVCRVAEAPPCSYETTLQALHMLHCWRYYDMLVCLLWKGSFHGLTIREARKPIRNPAPVSFAMHPAAVVIMISLHRTIASCECDMSRVYCVTSASYEQNSRGRPESSCYKCSWFINPVGSQSFLSTKRYWRYLHVQRQEPCYECFCTSFNRRWKCKNSLTPNCV